MIEIIGIKRRSDGYADTVLGQHIKPAGVIRRIIKQARHDISNSSLTFKDFKPVGAPVQHG